MKNSNRRIKKVPEFRLQIVPIALCNTTVKPRENMNKSIINNCVYEHNTRKKN